MTRPLVTADANLLASGALRLRSDAAPVQFIDAWLAGRFSLVLSDFLLREVSHTFAKRYFVQRLGEDDRQAFGTLIQRRTILASITVSVAGVASHPEDDMVLATALSGNAQFVVTGDHQLLSLKSYQGLTLLSVKEFMATLPGLMR